MIHKIEKIAKLGLKALLVLFLTFFFALISIASVSKKTLLISYNPIIALNTIENSEPNSIFYAENYFISRLFEVVYDVKNSLGFETSKVIISPSDELHLNLRSYQFTTEIVNPDNSKSYTEIAKFILQASFNEKFILQNIKNNHVNEVLSWLKNCPNNYKKHYYSALCYAEIKNNNLAEYHYNQISGKDTQTEVLKSKIEFNKGNYQTAYTILNKHIATNNSNAELLYQLGLCSYELKKYNEAVGYFAKASNIEPENSDIWHNWADALVLTNNNDEAIDKYKTALQLYPFDAFAWNNLGQVYDNLDDFQNSLFYYKKAIELDNENPLFNFNVGDNFIKLENYQEAIPYLEKSLKFDSEYAWAWHHLGDAYFETGKKKEGMDWLMKSIALEPDSFRFYNNIASKFIELKQLDNAEKYIKTALELNPNFGISWSTYAEIEHYKGNKLGYIEKTKKAVANGFSLKNYIDNAPDVFYKNEPEIQKLLN